MGCRPVAVVIMHNALIIGYFLPHGAISPSGLGPPQYRGFTIKLRHTTHGKTPLEEWSARRRDLYLTTHKTHKRQHKMPCSDSNPQSQQASDRRPTPYTAYKVIYSLQPTGCFMCHRFESRIPRSSSAVHCTLMWFVCGSDPAAVISMYKMNWLVFTADTGSVYCAVRIESLCAL